MLGTELVRKLRKSGTGERKLAVAMAFLLAPGNGRADAEDVYENLRQHAETHRDVGFLGTLEKAATIIREGDWVPKEQSQVMPEDQLEAETSGLAVKGVAEVMPASFDFPTLDDVGRKDQVEELTDKVNELLRTVAKLRGANPDDATQADAAGGTGGPAGDGPGTKAENVGTVPAIGLAKPGSELAVSNAPIGPTATGHKADAGKAPAKK